MVLRVLQAGSMRSKPPPGIGMRSFTGDKNGFDALAPLSTRASPLRFAGAEEGSASSLSPSWFDSLGWQMRYFQISRL